MTTRRSTRSVSRPKAADGTYFAKQVVQKRKVNVDGVSTKNKATSNPKEKRTNVSKSLSSSDESDEDIVLSDLRGKSANVANKKVTFAKENIVHTFNNKTNGSDIDDTTNLNDNSAVIAPLPSPTKTTVPKTVPLPHFKPIDEDTLIKQDHEMFGLLQERGLFARIIDSDGNCFFKAVGDQMGDPFGNATHLLLRKRVCDWEEKHKDTEIVPFMDDHERAIGVDTHITKMRENKEYALQHEVKALSAVLKRFVHIYTYDTTNDSIFVHEILHESVSPEEVTGPPICMSRHMDNHYNSLRSPSDNLHDNGTGCVCSHGDICIMKNAAPEICNTCHTHTTHRLCSVVATGIPNRLICKCCAASSNEVVVSEETNASSGTVLSEEANASSDVPATGSVEAANPVILDVNTTCNTFEEVYSITRNVAILSGMRPSELAYYCNTYFNEEDSKKAFGCTQVTIKDKLRSIPRRLRFYCTHKTCLWSVGWAWSHDKKVYQVTTHFSQSKIKYDHCLGHNHPTQTVNVDGYIFVSKEDDLTPEEKKFIEYNSHSNGGIPDLKVAMMKEFQDKKRDYCDKLLSRWRKKHLDNYYGPDRHQMGKLRTAGLQVRDEGGVWIEDHDETWRLNGTTKQTFIQREYAKEFGGFIEVDGTYGTNAYGFIAGLYIGVCSLYFSTIFGLNTMPAENTHDIARSCEKFSLCNDSNPPSDVVHMEQVPISNKVLLNSDKGTIFTDEGSWSEGVAKCVGKDHGYCTLHKTTNIFSSRGGLGGKLGDEYVEDMYDAIYGDHTKEELDELLQTCMDRYGHETKPHNFIKSVIEKKEKVCHTYMKFTFSHGHTTTARSEGQNAAVKAHGKLVAFLSKATLYEMHHQIVETLSRKQRRRAIKELGELRIKGCRTSEYYRSLLEDSIKQCTLKVESCEKPQGTDERSPNNEKGGGAFGIYVVKDVDGNISFVNVKTRVIHRGQLYLICSCTCSFWMSRKVHCKCIVAACKCAKIDVFHISTVHPIFHIQRHPCWKDALTTVCMEDYKDFEFHNSPSMIATKKIISESGSIVGGDDSLIPKQIPLQSRFFEKVDFIPPRTAERISNIRGLWDQMETKIELGNGHVYQRAYARMLMLLNELDGVIDNNTGEALDIRRPATKKEKKRSSKKDLENKSPLVYRQKGRNSSKSGGGKGRGGSGKKRSSKTSSNTRRKRQNTTTSNERLSCFMCAMLVQKTNQMLRTDHDASDCPNYDEYQEACAGAIANDGDTSMKTEGEA